MANGTDEADYTIYENNENTSQRSPEFPPFPGPPPMPVGTLMVGLVTGVVGMCANAVVLVVLMYGRRYFRNKVNTLITNQSAMDLFACIFLATSFVMSLPGASQNYLVLGEVGNNLVCFLFRNRVLSIVSMNAAKIGLVVIEI